MLKFRIENGEPKIRIFITSPHCYLDHWALRLLSEEEELGTRFSKALKSLNGTLSISWLNLVEFTAVSDPRQIEIAENFIDNIRETLFFIELNPWVVIKTEEEAVKSAKVFGEVADTIILNAFARMERTGLDPISCKGLFSQLPKNTPHIEGIADIFIRQIEKMRGQYLSKPKLKKLVNRPIQRSIYPPTHLLAGELLKPLIKNQRQKITSNDAADFMHAIVPLSYCDYVALDSHWASEAEKAANRLIKAGQKEKVARVFKKESGIIELIGILESLNIRLTRENSTGS